MLKSEIITKAIEQIDANRPDINDFITMYMDSDEPKNGFAGSEFSVLYDNAYKNWYPSLETKQHLTVALSVAIADEYLIKMGLLK